MDSTLDNVNLEIQQEINKLIIKFSNSCGSPSYKDLLDIVELVNKVNENQNGGSYNNLVQETYVGPIDVVIPANFLHAFSLNVLEGSIEYGDTNFPAGTSRSIEFSTLNSKPVIFKVNGESKVFFEYLKL